MYSVLRRPQARWSSIAGQPIQRGQPSMFSLVPSCQFVCDLPGGCSCSSDPHLAKNTKLYPQRRVGGTRRLWDSPAAPYASVAAFKLRETSWRKGKRFHEIHHICLGGDLRQADQHSHSLRYFATCFFFACNVLSLRIKFEEERHECMSCAKRSFVFLSPFRPTILQPPPFPRRGGHLVYSIVVHRL